MSDQIQKITKRYIIDMLNLTFFSSTVSWDGIDQYHALPIIDVFDNALCGKTEVRHAAIVYRRTRAMLGLSVCLSEEKTQFKANYRIVSLKKPVELNGVKYLPFEHLAVDISASDSCLGFKHDAEYSFSFNNDAKESTMFNLLEFIINSDFVALDDPKALEDAFDKDQVCNYPPVAGDLHYKPIFTVARLDTGNYVKY